MIFDPFATVTHDLLLRFIPFGSGYLCDVEGEPCMASVRTMLVFQTIIAADSPNQVKKITNEVN
jgi:hypothetical protein